MQESEEFCRKIDMKLKRSIISTFAVLFAFVSGAAVLMYIFAPIDDFMVDMFRDGNICTGSNGDFLMTMSQSDSNSAFSVTSSDFSNGVFTAVICGKNMGTDDMILTPSDLIVYVTDTSNGCKPCLCRSNKTEKVVIPAGSLVEFTVFAEVEEDFTNDGCKVSLIISAENCGKKYGLALN